jgi:NMD protein affecting ribosome stability and mRNA decay
MTTIEMIPCTICGKPTPMLGTKLCNRCWELRSRILADPELARKIINEMDGPEREGNSD